MAVALIALGACHMEDSPRNDTKPKASGADELWALAPAGADAGLVLTPRGLGMIEHAWGDLRGALHAAPDLALIAAEIDARLTATVGKPDVHLADLGFTADKGLALFYTREPESVIAVFPISDRAAFLKAVGGKQGPEQDTLDGGAICKPVGTAYACARTADQLLHLGGGKLAALARAAPRGELEIAGAFGDIRFTVAGQFSRGQVVLRSSIKGLPPEVLDKVSQPIQPRPLAGAAGFGVANVSKFMAAMAPDTAIVEGVTVAELSHALDAPLTMLAPTHDLALDMQIPVKDPKPVAAVLQHCDIVGLLFAGTGTAKDGGCAIEGMTLKFGGDIWLADNVLHIGKRGLAPGPAVAPTELGTELAGGTWGFAVWGRGSVFAAPDGSKHDDLEPREAMMVRALATLSEVAIAAKQHGDALDLVFAVRTIWSNPDDVAAKILALAPQQIVSGEATPAAKAIADAAPGSPFATDFAAGTNGMIVPTSVLGLGAYLASASIGNYFMARELREQEPLPAPDPQAP
ncbi:MAG TPA: hypothetical protein VGM88_03720 [Kofleriaceae bacterium]